MSDNVLEDFIEVEDFARQVKRTPRTVFRWMNLPDGLPYTYCGSRRIVHVPTAREWLLAAMRNPNPTKRKGR